MAANPSDRVAVVSAGATAALVAVLGASYVVSIFLRSSVAVIAPDLAAELAISAAQIGVLSSAFFFSFAAAQIPLGIAIDRYGPKRCMLVCAAILITATLLFGLATTAAGLIAARILMGLGASCYLMAPLVLYARRYPPERFSALAGLQLGVGSLGALLATAPLAAATAALGWRASFFLVAGATALVATLIAAIVRSDSHPAAGSPAETLRQNLAGVREAWRTPYVRRLFLMQMATYSSFIFFVGLWGGPYLSHVYGYSLTERGALLLIPASTQAVGMVLWGTADRLLGSYKLGVMLGATVTIVLLGGLATAGAPPPAVLWGWLALFGCCSAFTPVVIAHGKSLFAPRLVGRGMTLLNMGTMAGVFVSQTLSGLVLDLFPAASGVYPLSSYRLIFAMQCAFLLAALLVYTGTRDPLHERKMQGDALS